MRIHDTTKNGSLNHLISRQSFESFNKFADLAPKSYANTLDDLSSKLVSRCRSWKNLDNSRTPAKLAKLLFDKKFSQVSKFESVILQISLIAKLAKMTPIIVERENLPNSILGYYPSAFDRLAIVLEKVAENPLNTSYNLFNRIGFVLAINVPCGAQLLDLRSTVPLTSVILSVYRERSPKNLIRYVRCKGFGIWFRGHTDVEYLDEFNEDGWDKFYLRIAELLLRRKNVRGLVGTSWFYDPQLVNITPRLSYLQLRQIERGAFHMRHRDTELDIMFATKTSNTRRRLYQEGRYNPVPYSLIWDRNELINWAKGFWSANSNKDGSF